MKKILIAMMLICVGGCQKLEIATGQPCEVVESRIRDYYVAKYPSSFGEIVALRKESFSVWTEYGYGHKPYSDKRAALYKECPVTEGYNSWGGPFNNLPYFYLTEKTEAAESTIHVVSLDLYREKDGTCRVVARFKERKKEPYDVAAPGKPITEAELQEILK